MFSIIVTFLLCYLIVGGITFGVVRKPGLRKGYGGDDEANFFKALATAILWPGAIPWLISVRIGKRFNNK